jgi:hypothetical protein
MKLLLSNEKVESLPIFLSLVHDIIVGDLYFLTKYMCTCVCFFLSFCCMCVCVYFFRSVLTIENCSIFVSVPISPRSFSIIIA